ncbi:MAG: type II toxin-antitoxin system HicA family toxin [Saprospiraceae bacterium]
MNPVELERLVKKFGGFLDHQNGSHRIFKHSTVKGIIVIPFHGSKDLPKGTTQSILKKAGLK